MKKMITLICVILISINSYASGLKTLDSSRVNEILINDSYDRLQTIAKLEAQLTSQEQVLSDMEVSLGKEIDIAAKQNTAKVILKEAVVETAITAGLLFVLRKPPGSDTGIVHKIKVKLAYIGGGLMITTPVTAIVGGIKYALNMNDAEELIVKVGEAKINIQKTRKMLTKETVQLCKAEPRHKLCY